MVAVAQLQLLSKPNLHLAVGITQYRFFQEHDDTSAVVLVVLGGFSRHMRRRAAISTAHRIPFPGRLATV